MVIRKNLLIVARLVLGFMLGLVSVHTLQAREFTKENPLVYEDAWDLWPYVFLNERGQPEGYNVDMLKMIFEELGIPYVIRLKPTMEALGDLKARRSDLMLGMAADFHDEYASYGHEVVQLFTHSILAPKASTVSVRVVDDLRQNQVIVHAGSFSHHLMLNHGWGFNAVPYDDMKEAVHKVATDGRGLILWNTQSLKWLLNKYHTTSLKLTPVDIPHGEYRFMSNDSTLLQRLDSTYARLVSSERMVPVLNKWFYPERVETGVPDWIEYAALAAAVLVFLLLYYYVVLKLRERSMTKLIARHNRRLALILRTTRLHVWLYDVKSECLAWMGANGEMDQRQHTLQEYAHIYTKDTFHNLGKTIDAIVNGVMDNGIVELVSDNDYGSRDNFVKLSVFRRNRRGKPTVIVGMMDDQTDRLLSRRKAKDDLLRYQTIFSTSMVDMTYYNVDGVLTDINQKACQTFNCEREDILAEHVPLKYALEDPDLVAHQFEGSYSTHLIKAVGNVNLAHSIKFEQNIYYEQQLYPVYDSANRFLGVFGSGRDVTEFVNSYHQLKRSVNDMMRAAQDVTEYINNINYALHVGGVRLVNYSPDTHILTIYREMNVVQLRLTQSRCLSLLDEGTRQTAIRLINNMDMRVAETMDIEVKANVKHSQNSQLSLQFHLSPVYNKQGGVESYFGMCRDVTQVKATEEGLEREKAKAQEVEGLKNAFLRNMSYEIRTPISIVVGFAELFVDEHDPADEDNFIKEIKQNATYLLKLVNDILFLSRLDAHMIEFKKVPVDFAMTFESHCHIGWDGSKKDGVSYIVVNPYEHLELEIDEGNVGHIIEEVAENAADNTTTGFVRARYDYIGDRLLITIEDTGCGMDEERRQTIFERFISSSGRDGSGLGLPICKELTQQMDGVINVNSAAGKGTTVWIEIPCKALRVEKRMTVN